MSVTSQQLAFRLMGNSKILACRFACLIVNSGSMRKSFDTRAEH